MYPSSKQLITSPPSLKNILAEVTHQNFTNLHGLLHPIVPVSSTMNNQDLEMVNMLKIWKIDVNIHHHSLAHPCQRKFQLKWYILMSATPLIFFSLLFLPSTMSSTINSHELNVFRRAESVKTFMSTNAMFPSWRQFQPKWFILFVSHLPGLLLHVVLAVHSAVDHQTT